MIGLVLVSPSFLGAKRRPHAQCRCCHSCPRAPLMGGSVGCTARGPGRVTQGDRKRGQQQHSLQTAAWGSSLKCKSAHSTLPPPTTLTWLPSATPRRASKAFPRPRSTYSAHSAPLLNLASLCTTPTPRPDHQQSMSRPACRAVASRPTAKQTAAAPHFRMPLLSC